jgi:hypothetical protein
MRAYVLASVVTLLGAVDARADDAKPAPEPRVVSIHPFSGSLGTSYVAVVRGRNLKAAHGVEVTGEGIRGRVLRVDQEPATDTDSKSSFDLVQIEISSEASARAGDRGVRLLTGNGVTNAVNVLFGSQRVIAETDVPGTITSFPLVVSGRIAQRGEVDTFWLDAATGQTLTFAVRSGHSSMDPSVALFRRAPTWLDPNHMEQIAFNDEPLFFPGISTDAHLVHTFREGGRYCLKVQSSTGQGSADAVYQLRISAEAEPAPAARPKLQDKRWEERQFTRSLSSRRHADLNRRGALPEEADSTETFHATRVGSDEPLPVMRLPGVVEGTIGHPAEAHRLKLRVDKAENIAIEIETPEATMPRFNPVILLFEPGGAEVATNVYTKRNNNGLYMMKMIQPKVALSLHAPGEYQLEIRDITTDRAGDDFKYRVLIRRQIPHVGKIDVAEDQINLRPGATREVNITVEREEGFSGLVAFAVEGLPHGVIGLPAAPKPIEKPPLPNGGKLERYTPIVQNSAIVLTAAPDAAPMQNMSKVRIVARPMANGKLGAPIVVKELPLMIVSEKGT